MNMRTRVGLALTALVLAACGGNHTPSASPTPTVTSTPPGSPAPAATPTRGASTPPPRGTLRVAGTVATGLSAPWGLAFLPDGTALVSERDKGRIVRITRTGGVRPVGDVPGVDAGGEGGLLGIAVSPDFARDSWVYAYLTAAADNRLVRMKYDAAKPDDSRLGAPQSLLTGIAKGQIHNGGRIAFGPDGLLYVSTGDASESSNSQDGFSLNGKILRLTRDGEAAPANPGGEPVYSLGHRNVQGLAWDGDQLWASEFGQDTYDELNRIERGGNYGWPVVEGPSHDSRFIAPQASWGTDEASPSGLAIRGRVAYLAALKGQRLWRVPIRGGRAGTPKAYFTGKYGRLRTVAVAPDGSLWLITSNTDGRGNVHSGDDRIVRLAGN